MTDKIKNVFTVSWNMILSAAIGVGSFAAMQLIEWGSYKEKINEHERWIQMEQKLQQGSMDDSWTQRFYMKK